MKIKRKGHRDSQTDPTQGTKTNPLVLTRTVGVINLSQFLPVT